MDCSGTFLRRRNAHPNQRRDPGPYTNSRCLTAPRTPWPDYFPSGVLVPGFKIAAIDVSVTFDTPIATTADKWSVALILKSGDQTDQLSDHYIGVGCQFKTGGVYIEVFAPIPALPTIQADSGKTFGDYDNGCTQFTLHYTIKPNEQGTLTATGSLQVGTAAPVSPAPSFGINLANLDFVTAIGTSITTNASIPQIGATFRQFTINSITWTL
jgi:hypothetical protein